MSITEHLQKAPKLEPTPSYRPRLSTVISMVLAGLGVLLVLFAVVTGELVVVLVALGAAFLSFVCALVGFFRRQPGEGLPVRGLLVSLVAGGMVLSLGLLGMIAIGLTTPATEEDGVWVRSVDGSNVTQDGDYIGSWDVPAELGSTVGGGWWEVTVEDVAAIAKDSRGRAPGAGKALLEITISATYTGTTEAGEALPSQFAFYDTDVKAHAEADTRDTFTAADQIDRTRLLTQGETLSGALVIEVPAAKWAEGRLAVRPGRWSGTEAWIAVS